MNRDAWIMEVRKKELHVDGRLQRLGFHADGL